MHRGRIFEITVGILLVVVLSFGGTAHALVPHTHGDHHHRGESAVWQSLHASLRHEDKKALPFFYVLAVLGAVALLVLVSNRMDGISRILDDDFESLKRGVFAYRRFG
jgi:hypothetical protein